MTSSHPSHEHFLSLYSMATIQSFIESLEAKLTCSVCQQVLNEPKTLPSCHHTFCFKCIEGLSKAPQTDKRSLKCPICKTAVDCEGGDISQLSSLSTYNSLLRLLEPMKKTADKVQRNQQQLSECTNCSKPSVLEGFCLQCEGMICGDCINYHKTLNVFRRTHQATAFKNINQEILDSYITNRAFCKETLHEKYRHETYCRTCKKCICYLCAAQTHKNHDKVSVEEAAEDAKRLIRQDKDRLDELLVGYQRQLEASDENMRRVRSQVEAAKAQVRNRTQAMIRALQNRQDSIMATLDNIVVQPSTSNDQD